VEQELLTLPEHLSSSPVVCPFVLFLLVIVLSVLLRFTDSDYLFGIFKLFLCQLKNSQVVKYITLKFGTDYGGKFLFSSIVA
jgi:hypothetical protein